MKPSFSHSRGQLVANFLAGSWRDKQPALDICVSDLELVTRLLYDSGGAGHAWWVDLHSQLSELRDRSTEELLARSGTANLRETRVRVLCPEDNLALLAI